MTPTEELRFLTVVLKRIEGGNRAAARSIWLLVATWLLLVAAFVVLFSLASSLGSTVFVVAGVSGLLGVLTAFVVIRKASRKQWPVLAPFIEVEEIKLRINELKPNTSFERTRGP
jgi:hypothetical protein